MKVITEHKGWSYIGLYTKEGHFDPSQVLDGLSPRTGGYMNCGSVAIVFQYEI
jgi:hypothetical protein